MELKVCRRNKYGYCKYGDKCQFRHVEQICSENTCDIFYCYKRHPRVCHWYQQYGRCKFTSFCKFKHTDIKNFEDIVNKMEHNENKLNEINKMLEDFWKEECEIMIR